MSEADTTRMTELEGINEATADALSQNCGYNSAEELARGYLTDNPCEITISVDNINGISRYIEGTYFTNEELGYPDAERPVYEVMYFIRLFGAHLEVANETLAEHKVVNNPDKEGKCISSGEVTADEIDFSLDKYPAASANAYMTFGEYGEEFSKNLGPATSVHTRSSNVLEYKRGEATTTHGVGVMKPASCFLNIPLYKRPEHVLMHDEIDEYPAVFYRGEYEGEIVSASLGKDMRQKELP